MNSMDTLLQLMEVYGYAAMFVAMVAENANIPIPSEVVLGFAVPHFPAYFRFLDDLYYRLCSRGNRLRAELLARFVWRRPLLLKYGKYIFFNEKKFNMAEKMFNKYGGIAVIICAVCPVYGRSFPSRPASARYPFGRFVLFTIIGTIPWTLLLVWAGSVLGTIGAT